MAIAETQQKQFRRNVDAKLTATFTTPGSVAGWTFQFTVEPRGGGAAFLTKLIGDGIDVVTAGDATTAAVLLISFATDTLPQDSYRAFVYRTDAGQREELANADLTILDKA